MTQPALLGIGTAVPSLRLTRPESLAAAQVLCSEDDGHAESLAALYRQSGVEARHVVYRPAEYRKIVHGEGGDDTPFVSKGRGDLGPSTAVRMERYEREALPLAIEASRTALERAAIGPERITQLITVSCTGFAAPGVDVGLMKRLGLSPTVGRTHVGFMGCHGALNGLRVARGLIAADPGSHVLLCSVELCSLHYAYGWDPKRMVGNMLFADGAAAVVLGGDHSPGSGPGAWRHAASGACLFDDCERAMSWHVRDHGFEMTLSTKVPGLIRENLRPWLESWLSSVGLSVGGVGSWAVHPGGPRVLNCVGEALGLPPDATVVSRSVLSGYGNMSSATVLFILDELTRRGAPRPCVALGFGPGLAAEVALFR